MIAKAEYESKKEILDKKRFQGVYFETDILKRCHPALITGKDFLDLNTWEITTDNRHDPQIKNMDHDLEMFFVEQVFLQVLMCITRRFHIDTLFRIRQVTLVKSPTQYRNAANFEVVFWLQGTRDLNACYKIFGYLKLEQNGIQENDLWRLKTYRNNYRCFNTDVWDSKEVYMDLQGDSKRNAKWLEDYFKEKPKHRYLELSLRRQGACFLIPSEETDLP